MKTIVTRFTLIAALLAAGSFYGCGDKAPASAPVEEGTGGRKATGGSPGTGGAKATGGAGGSSAKGGASGNGSGGSGAQDSGAGNDADAPESSDVPAGSDDVAADSKPSDTGAGGTSGSDAGGKKIAACAKDPMGLTTCRQLEIACENCPPKGPPETNPKAKICFDDVIHRAFLGQATDEECAKFAVDNKCTVDPGGNICVTLNCDGSPGCDNKDPLDRKTCIGAARYGQKADCLPYVAKCACK